MGKIIICGMVLAIAAIVFLLLSRHFRAKGSTRAALKSNKEVEKEFCRNFTRTLDIQSPKFKYIYIGLSQFDSFEQFGGNSKGIVVVDAHGKSFQYNYSRWGYQIGDGARKRLAKKLARHSHGICKANKIEAADKKGRRMAVTSYTVVAHAGLKEDKEMTRRKELLKKQQKKNT